MDDPVLDSEKVARFYCKGDAIPFPIEGAKPKQYSYRAQPILFEPRAEDDGGILATSVCRTRRGGAHLREAGKAYGGKRRRSLKGWFELHCSNVRKLLLEVEATASDLYDDHADIVRWPRDDQDQLRLCQELARMASDAIQA